MPTYQAVIDGVEQTIEAPTGDYRLAVAMAVALADRRPPCTVKIWSDAVVSDYGPYWYRVKNDAYGDLVVSAGL